MGYTIPGWLDEVLDCIGVNFPNVDEDDYREMASAMREFADNFEGKGGDAHQAVSRILSSSQGWAVDAMEKHWSHVKAGHLDKLPELARLFADACDAVADIAVVRVNPGDPHPDSTTGMIWREKFEQCMTDRRNRNERGERVPPTGLVERPQHMRNPRRRKCKST